MFSFLPLINNSTTIGLSLLLVSISAIISSKTISILCYLCCILQCFYIHKKIYNDESDEGYFLEVDFQHLQKLHELHNYSRFL